MLQRLMELRLKSLEQLFNTRILIEKNQHSFSIFEKYSYLVHYLQP